MGFLFCGVTCSVLVLLVNRLVCFSSRLPTPPLLGPHTSVNPTVRGRLTTPVVLSSPLSTGRRPPSHLLRFRVTRGLRRPSSLLDKYTTQTPRSPGEPAPRVHSQRVTYSVRLSYNLFMRLYRTPQFGRDRVGDTVSRVPVYPFTRTTPRSPHPSSSGIR